MLVQESREFKKYNKISCSAVLILALVSVALTGVVLVWLHWSNSATWQFDRSRLGAVWEMPFCRNCSNCSDTAVVVFANRPPCLVVVSSLTSVALQFLLTSAAFTPFVSSNPSSCRLPLQWLPSSFFLFIFLFSQQAPTTYPHNNIQAMRPLSCWQRSASVVNVYCCCCHCWPSCGSRSWRSQLHCSYLLLPRTEKRHFQWAVVQFCPNTVTSTLFVLCRLALKKVNLICSAFLSTLPSQFV